MNSYLSLSDKDKADYCMAAAASLGIPHASVEKDFWVCWTLRELFSLEDIGAHLTFKGGTSLSKGWAVIKRFSEDIDVVISREYLGFQGKDAPEEPGISGKERDRRLSRLSDSCQNMIKTTLEPQFRTRAEHALHGQSLSIELDHDDDAGETILFAYPSVFRKTEYIRPIVRIELGARSDIEPVADPTIEPYVYQELRNQLGDASFKARTVAAERTFWEKASLLHEENYRAGGAAPKPRMARHYYDIWSLINAGIGEKAARNRELFQRVVEHRKIFFRRNSDARDSLKHGTLKITPSEDHLEAWKRDYADTRESMIFGDAPTFEEVLTSISAFEREFNAVGSDAV